SACHRWSRCNPGPSRRTASAHPCRKGCSMRNILIAAAMLVSLPGLTLITSPAHAVSLDVTCAGTETATYNPGLLITSQTTQVAVTGILAACTSSDPGITSGSYSENFPTTLSCATIFAGRAGTRTIRWSNGQSTTFEFTRAINNAAGQITVTFTGDATSGEFTGDTVIEQVVFVTPNALQCLAPPGLTQIGPGIATVTIDKL